MVPPLPPPIFGKVCRCRTRQMPRRGQSAPQMPPARNHPAPDLCRAQVGGTRAKPGPGPGQHYPKKAQLGPCLRQAPGGRLGLPSTLETLLPRRSAQAGAAPLGLFAPPELKSPQLPPLGQPLPSPLQVRTWYRPAAHSHPPAESPPTATPAWFPPLVPHQSPRSRNVPGFAHILVKVQACRTVAAHVCVPCLNAPKRTSPTHPKSPVLCSARLPLQTSRWASPNCTAFHRGGGVVLGANDSVSGVVWCPSRVDRHLYTSRCERGSHLSQTCQSPGEFVKLQAGAPSLTL